MHRRIRKYSDVTDYVLIVLRGCYKVINALIDTKFDLAIYSHSLWTSLM